MVSVWLVVLVWLFAGFAVAEMHRSEPNPSFRWWEYWAAVVAWPVLFSVAIAFEIRDQWEAWRLRRRK